MDRAPVGGSGGRRGRGGVARRPPGSGLDGPQTSCRQAPGRSIAGRWNRIRNGSAANGPGPGGQRSRIERRDLTG